MQHASWVLSIYVSLHLASSVSFSPALYALCILQAAQEAEGSGTSSSEDELADAQVAVAEATSSGRIKDSSGSVLASVFEVASLIFLAEWGDRSMLATIALGAAQVRAGGGYHGVGCFISLPESFAFLWICHAPWRDARVEALQGLCYTGRLPSATNLSRAASQRNA